MRPRDCRTRKRGCCFVQPGRNGGSRDGGAAEEACVGAGAAAENRRPEEGRNRPAVGGGKTRVSEKKKICV